jgi:multidrug efflux pump subunit AcrB
MKKVVLTFLLVAQSLVAEPPASAPPVEFEFKASPKIAINREQASKEGVSIMDLTKRVQAYFEARDQFTLEELRSLEIATRDGRIVKLSQVASVEVVFKKAKAKVIAEQVGGGGGG